MLKRTLFLTLAIVVLGFGLLIAILPSPKPDTSQASSSKDGLLLQNARLFDGETTRENVDLLVRNGEIAGIGPDLDATNVQTLDMAGKTIIPGLIDAHTHTYGSALTTSLRFGVTSNLDMFMAASLFAPEKARRNSLDPTAKADVFSATTLATVEGGYGTQYGFPIDTLNGPDSAPAWVDKRVEEGADYIKLVYIPRQNRIPSLDLETASAIIDAAHDSGLLVMAHISTQRAAEEMIDAGIDGLVHLFGDVEVSDAFIAKAKAADIFIIPTLAVIASVNARGHSKVLSEDPLIAPFLLAGQSSLLSQSFGAANVPGYRFDLALNNVRRLHEAGVTILAGTDAPNPGTLHGASLHQELAYYVEAGMTAEEALASATSKPAIRFSLPHQRGHLKQGARADFVVLNSDPLSDVSATKDIHAIYKNGVPVERLPETSNSNSEPMPSAIAQFDTGMDAPDGWRWMHTDDRFAGGKSEASVSFSEKDGGTLAVSAEIKSGFPFPWGGAFLTREGSDEPGSVAAYDALEFTIRGTPGTYSVMMFTPDTTGVPPTQTFSVTEVWTKVSLPFDGFNGLDPNRLIGMAIVAGPERGDFQYQIDNVSLAN